MQPRELLAVDFLVVARAGCERLHAADVSKDIRPLIARVAGMSFDVCPDDPPPASKRPASVLGAGKALHQLC